IVDPIINCSEIRRGIIKSTIALANDARLIGQLGDIAKENADCAFTDFRDAGFEQAINGRWQAIVIETLSALDVVMDVEQFVNVLEILHREGDTLVPNIEVFSVAALQLDQFLATAFPNLRIACRSFA